MTQDVTRLIRAWRGGDGEALDLLLPLVYTELRALAGQRLRHERPDHTLQPTALVHEVYVRLVGVDIDVSDRVHFFAVAARSMRRILVDHARARARLKRGGGHAPITLDERIAAVAERPEELVELDEALERLAALDPRRARVVELHYFGGLTYPEIGEALDVSEVTVYRDLRLARAWLADALRPDPGDAPGGDGAGSAAGPDVAPAPGGRDA
jgi:RNA polymerase sigma factor (TIGR02999 family)